MPYLVTPGDSVPPGRRLPEALTQVRSGAAGCHCSTTVHLVAWDCSRIEPARRSENLFDQGIQALLDDRSLRLTPSAPHPTN